MTIEAGPDELYTTRAREADAPVVAELVNAAYRGAASRRGWTTELGLVEGPRTDEAAIARLLAEERGAILVVRAQTGLFAAAHVQAGAGDVARLGFLAVRPAMQGSQLGRQMLDAAASYAAAEFGARVLELEIIASREEVVAWLERRGFVTSGATRPFAAADGDRGVAVGLELATFRRPIAPPRPRAGGGGTVRAS